MVSQIQKDIFQFLLNLRKATIGQFITETSKFLLNDLFKSRRLSLPEYVNEVIGWTLLINFGEFWEIARQIHSGLNQQGTPTINIMAVLSDHQIQEYLISILGEFEENCLTAISSIWDTEMVSQTYSLVQNMIKLPV
jgi:hypothetical protein